MFIKEINLKYRKQSLASRCLQVYYASIWIFQVSLDICDKIPIFWVKKVQTEINLVVLNMLDLKELKLYMLESNPSQRLYFNSFDARNS